MQDRARFHTGVSLEVDGNVYPRYMITHCKQLQGQNSAYRQNKQDENAVLIDRIFSFSLLVGYLYLRAKVKPETFRKPGIYLKNIACRRAINVSLWVCIRCEIPFN